MTTHAAALELLLALPEVADWPALRNLVTEVATRRERNWLLPLTGCQAVGGAEAAALPAVAALGCTQLSIILVDDQLDADPRGLHHIIGAADAANLSVALQGVALAVLAAAPAPPSVRAACLAALNHAAYATAYGQHLDVLPVSDEPGYWRVARAKSGPFFGVALELGARLGGGDEAAAQALACVGRLYGEMIQIHDDLHDTLATPANPDWLAERGALPLLFARLVPHRDRERFLALHPLVVDPAALAEAQTILLRCGAVSYCLHHLFERHTLAQKLLAETPLADPAPVAALLEEIVDPLRRLFDRLGLAWPARQN